jgi:hypothetical protein
MILAAIEFFDNVISIIRRRDKSDNDRLREIGKLLLSSSPLPKARPINTAATGAVSPSTPGGPRSNATTAI